MNPGSGRGHKITPPRSFNDLPDIEPYRHLKRRGVVDAVTHGPVDGKTLLATLYRYSDPAVDNQLVMNFSGIVEPKVPCQLQIGDGKLFPPSDATGEHGYHFKVTYNKLNLAPVIRLEFQVIDLQKPGPRTLAQAVFEFHFNEYNDDGDEETAIQDYVHNGPRGTISFKTGRATCSGYNLTSKLTSRNLEKYGEVMEVLKDFLTPRERHEITLHLHEDSLTPAQMQALAQIRGRLPGGTDQLLATIGTVEYKAFGNDIHKTLSPAGSEILPCQLMAGDAPHQFVPQTCGPTFSTVKEAGAELGFSATVAYAESDQALKLWAKGEHKGQLFIAGKSVVLGVNFAPFGRLGDGNKSVQFNLPRELSCGFQVEFADRQSMFLEGFLMSGHPGHGVPGHHAFFVVTSHSVESFVKLYPQGPPKLKSVHCSPHYNSFTYTSQLATVRELQNKRNHRWHGILLNQVHSVLEKVDLTAGTDPESLAQADDWLLNFMHWNAEQLKVIRGIRLAKGGMVLVMGPAATGKTLLQRALAIYFYSLGFHILALAPANDNANKMARDMWLLLQEGLPMSTNNARDCELGTMAGGLPFPELLVAVDNDLKEKEAHRECGVVEAVIKAADEGKLELYKGIRSRERHDVHITDRENAWDILRKFIRDYREGKVDWKRSDVIERCRLAYNACKGQIVGLNRFMITTTGNVRCQEMTSNWFNDESDYGVPRKGVIVFVDEAAKDFEVNVWAGVVCEKWADWVRGVFLFGDEKQLSPPNTSAKNDVTFNYYSSRLDIPLPSRLVREGFPCYYLVEQRRMHQAIASFPNRKIYNNKLRNGPGMDVSLEQQKPGLSKVLKRIIAGEMQYAENRARYMRVTEDHAMRLHHVQVDGTRRSHPSTKSMAVSEHVDVFFKKIFPGLLQYYQQTGQSMNNDVMIICCYNYQRGLYLDRFRALRDGNPHLTPDDIPRVLTIDSSQGDESFMVFLDGSAQHGDIIGHLDDENRFNVAITRAQGVLWTIGGRMLHARKNSGPRPLNLATEYKIELSGHNQVREFRTS